MKTEARAIEDLRLDDRCQVRADTDHAAIEDYAEAYRSDVELPPVEVVDVGGVLYVADGFQRVSAAIKAGHEFIRVHVVEHADDVERAQWIASSKNKAHGVRRTNLDKRRAIRMALDSGIGSEQSSRTIAEHVGVSQSLVSTMRREWEAEQVSSKLSTAEAGEPTADETPDTVTGRDGRQHPKTRRTPANGAPKKAKPSSTVDDEEDERHEPDPAERYAQAARMIDRLWQKLTGLLGTDDPVCDGLRELHRCAKHEAAA